MRYASASVLLVLAAALAGCSGGSTSGGDGATTTAPAPTETRTVSREPDEQPTATVTEEPAASPTAAPTRTPPPDIAPQGEATDCLATVAQPTIQDGSTGPAVRKAQCYLNLALAGTPIPEDGDFGPVTDDATRRFQACAGITVDGLIGPQTWSYLILWADAGTPVC
ncbi:peptidoglycan-binding domain-containing protein [Streptomyces sp. TR06-5]|uniref:peptidoglycan-binding domain-containing protein n=1 Tax=Streptomyces sp. TR06-5 TaxID=3385976 RepID=UPI0039A1BC8C